MTNETASPGWDAYQDISNTLTQLLSKGYTKPMIKTVLEQKRDCKTCKHSDNGNCAGTEECRECMWESKYEQQPCDDCISKERIRRVLSDEVFALMKLHTVNPEDNPNADAMALGVNWSLNTLMEFSPDPPQRPEGRWIATENEEMNIVGYFCSCCDLPMETEERTKYCPNCGAKMKAESEDKE